MLTDTERTAMLQACWQRELTAVTDIANNPGAHQRYREATAARASELRRRLGE